MLLQVVQAGVGDGHGVALETGDAGPGHLELADLALDRRNHQRRGDLQRGGSEVTVEEEVKVLIGSNAAYELVPGLAGRMVRQLNAQGPSSVAMSDPRGQLLQCDVHEPVDR